MQYGLWGLRKIKALVAELKAFSALTAMYWVSQQGVYSKVHGIAEAKVQY